MKLKEIILIFEKIFKYIPKKYKLYKQEQAYKQLFEERGSLTKYHLKDSRIKVGNMTYGVPQITEYSGDWKLEIGNYCCISNDVEFIFGGQHNYQHVSQYAFIPQVQKLFPTFTYRDRPCKSLLIGNDVWIGKNVTVLGGVEIGDGAVIGANSVVRRDVPPYAIVIGNPAQIVKFRFKTDQIEALERIRWWNWDFERIKKNISLIMSPDIDKFISQYDINS